MVVKWIPLSSKAPDFGEQVLISTGRRVYTATRYEANGVEYWAVNNTGNSRFSKATEIEVVKAKAIKYWMPLPPAPE